jgi:chromosome segregation ATPase
MSEDYLIRALERLNDRLDDIDKKQSETRTMLEVHVKTSEITEEHAKTRHDDIKQNITKQAKQLELYNQYLKEHMRRTELLENRIKPIEDDYVLRKTKKNLISANWKKISMFAAILSSFGAAVWAVVQIIGYISQINP